MTSLPQSHHVHAARSSYHSEVSDASSRTRALLAYDIMDSPKERDYDALIRLTRNVLSAPVALLSFVDDTRTWVKSSAGINLPTNIPKHLSLCGEAVESSEPFYEVDALHGMATSQNIPAHLERYIGAPIRAKNGEHIGVLAVMYDDAESFSSTQRETLNTLRRQIETMLEQRRALRMVERQQKELTRLVSQHDHLLKKISHDTRNVLSCVLSNCEFAVSELNGYAPMEDVSEALTDVLNSTRRIKDLLAHVEQRRHAFKDGSLLEEE